MKRTNRIISTLVIIAIFIASLSIVAYAEYDTRVIRASYSLGTGKAEWNGKDKGITYNLNPVDTRANFSITSGQTTSINAKVYHLIKWKRDEPVVEVSLTANGNSAQNWVSGYFVPDSAIDTYYPYIECPSKTGVTGYCSFDQ